MTKIQKVFRLLRWLLLHPLNRQHRWRAVSRFMRWQLATRILPEARFALPFANDSVLLMRRGMAGATGNWYAGLCEVNEMGFVAHVLGDGDLFIDIGANIGSYTVLAATGCSCRVISVEPSKDTFSMLQGNVKVNGLEHLVETHRVALSDRSGSIKFTTNCDTTNHIVPEGASNDDSGGYETVPVTTLDDLLGERYSSALKVIKLDVEGYELNVLKGAARTLASEHLLAVIVEINGSAERYSGTDAEIVEFLQGLGFSSYKYDAVARTVNGATGIRDITSENLIFTRNRQRIEDVIKSHSGSKIRVSTGYV